MLFLIGAAFGWWVRRGGPLFFTRTFACAVAAHLVAGVGVPVAAYLRFPDWMWGYYVDPRNVPGVVPAILFVLYGVPFLLGYGAPRKLEQWRPGKAWVALAAGLAAQAALLAWQWPRYTTVTTIEGFRAGVEVPPAALPFFRTAVPLAFGAAALLWWLARPKTFSPEPSKGV
ncbi:MAG: hypothetical protein ACK44W_05370 [Planctomycetota bacterium]